MSTETVSKGVRLPAQVWDAIEAEARSVKLSANDYLRRRLTTLFCPDSDAQKISGRSKRTAQDEVVELPE